MRDGNLNSINSLPSSSSFHKQSDHDAGGIIRVESDEANGQLLDGCQDEHQRLLDAANLAPGEAAEEQSTSLGDGTAASASSFSVLSKYDGFLAQNIPVLFDSGSDIHLLSLEAARALFTEQQVSDLSVLGVSGAARRAELKGNLVVRVQAPDSSHFDIDLGTAHGMSSCPANLLSVSLLIKQGCVIHFEDGNCYFKPSKGGSPISILTQNGMFKLDVSRGDARESELSGAQTFCTQGHSFATYGNLTLWHRRVRHLHRETLVSIHKRDIVEGFKLKGSSKASCGCDTCSQAKIRRGAVPSHSEFTDPADHVGHTVSTDVKKLPYLSFRGYKYVVNFIDHHSRLSFAYMMRLKSETSDKLKLFLSDMQRLKIKVSNIQSDRGSEYFSQVGDTVANRDRRQAEFTAICNAQEPRIEHIVRPVEMKEKLAEVFFRDTFRAVNAMLWEARLSPAFWADAVEYATYQLNRIPNDHLGEHTTPYQMVTGKKPNWSRFKVFGCDVWQHIPNNPYDNYPGIPRGRRLIFVGFDASMGGYKCFDPETRNYVTTANCYFNEDFSDRIDALRHHDQRRALLKRDAEQPPQMDDFADPNADAVRSIYLDPDQPLPPVPDQHPPGQDSAADAGAASGSAGPSPLSDSSSSTSSSTPPTPGNGGARPFSSRAVAAERVRELLQDGVVLRPLRLTPVGRPLPLTVEDEAFLKFALLHHIPVEYVDCPKSGESARRYRQYMLASTLKEAMEMGATWRDIIWDHCRSYIKYPGHVYNALSLAQSHGMTHTLQDADSLAVPDGMMEEYVHQAMCCSVDEYASHALNDSSALDGSTDLNDQVAHTYSVSSSPSFHEMLANVFEPDVILPFLEHAPSMHRFAEFEFAKVLSATSVDIDFSLPPEPTRFDQAASSDEKDDWIKAMDEEIASMAKFGVFKRVRRSAARGRQILGARWVYKRKTNRFGKVYRYRARLVAQGHLQKEYDSFNPDELYSPVAHKNSLRTFLSLCAGESLSVHQADVKAAFLQAPLREKIYLRAPPGYSTTTADGEEEILELSQAIYGLHQSSAAFYEALSEHLIAKGFAPIMGDPCVFRRVEPDGKVVLICTYVDDLTIGVTDQAQIPGLMSELRERFEIDSSEGGPIEYLLGIAVDQNIEAGTVHLSMEAAITKLCFSILTKEELAKSETVFTPMLTTPLKKQSERTVSKSTFDYLSVVGSLLHIVNCLRPDIAYAVGSLARFATTPGDQHVRACKRVLQYLFKTRALGITYSKDTGTNPKNVPFMYESAKHPLDNGTNKLQIFADSDYAADETRRSTMGSVIMMNGGPVSWSSVLGKTVALSTCEAEVNAAVEATKEALHLSRLLVDLGYSDGSPLQIAEDNAACIAQANTGLRHVRNAKHYEIRLRWLQQKVVDEAVVFKYCPTDLQIADLLTKPLDEIKFKRFAGALMSSKPL